MSEEAPPESLFRANKRRKIFRKRTPKEDQEDDNRETLNQPPISALSDALTDRDEDQAPVVRRPITKKQGISFSSSGMQQVDADGDGITETAMVPFHKKDAQAIHGDRFVKPTGKAEVVEDKHLMAYVDSKLAELRSSSSTPIPNQSTPPQTSETNNTAEVNLDPSEGGTRASMTSGQGVSKTQSSSRSAAPKNQKPRRGPPVRGADDVARDDLVDRIFRESDMGIYDQSASPARKAAATGVDNDEAAARAFKEQFLADLAQHNRRRPPPAPTAAKATTQTSTGPKLGGSRSQREKMKALEEAKSGVRKK